MVTDEANMNRLAGALEARTTMLEARFTNMEMRLETRLSTIDTRIAAIHDVVTGARGGWRMLGVLGAVMTVISGSAIAFYHFFFAR